MILCLDVGNSQIYGGVYHKDELQLKFRRRAITEASSDETGVFFRNVLRENHIEPDMVKSIAICSVVPKAVHSLRNACYRYFNINPFFIGPGTKCGLNIKYRNPVELGSDRIANAVAAVNRYPDKNIIIIDMGTATTFCAVSARKEFLGGAIMPGMRISMEALEKKTARLSSVEIIKMEKSLGRSTTEGIQSGLYFGTMGMIKEITGRLARESFGKDTPLIIGTGGFAGMYADTGLYDELVPDLVLSGIYQSLLMNS